MTRLLGPIAVLLLAFAPQGCMPTTFRTGCVELATGLCEAAVAIAREQGLFFDAGSSVASWRAEPTRASLCAHVAPLVDVTFLIAPSGSTIVVTVGQLRDGRLAICTY